ncbi:hypothetical protein Dda_5224 [Drechslerella dactyloides]|uniref:Uncharacterized protein n=1 Tax=Drechslerella dactyloides TaxID=74499 RepID=A0AAD6NHC1_DREDA|nr:hypothetical protein Dda_5224 [Drechslerella dactyloides]
MRLLVFLLVPLIPRAAGFILAFVRLPPAQRSGINYITRQTISGVDSLNACHQVPEGYFDIAQFIPDDPTPRFLKEYDFKPSEHRWWLTFPDETVTRVEFYTGDNCKNAVFEQDREEFLKESQIKTQRLRDSTLNQPMIRGRPSTDLMSQANNMLANIAQSNPSAMEIEDDEDENIYRDFDTDWPEAEDEATSDAQQAEDARLEATQPDVGTLGTTVREQMDIEPPVPNETKEQEISRQERNFMRFYNDVESDGGIALDNQFTTLQWKEKWKSYKFSYVPSSRVTAMRNRDL